MLIDSARCHPEEPVFSNLSDTQAQPSEEPVTDLVTADQESAFPPHPPCVSCGKIWPRATYHNDHDEQCLCDHCRGPNGPGGGVTAESIGGHGAQAVSTPRC